MSYYVAAALIETLMDLRGTASNSMRGFGLKDESLKRGPRLC